MSRMTKFFIAASAAIMLAGCYVPEDFDLDIDFLEDKQYQYRYKGNLVHAMAAMAAKEGKYGAKDEEILAKELSAAPGIKSVSSKGKGRFAVVLDDKGNVGKPLNLLGTFSIKQGKDGLVTMQAPAVKDNDADQLREVGIRFAGTIEVRLPKNVEVVQTNATSKPSMFSGTYGWKFGGAGPGPILTFRYKN